MAAVPYTWTGSSALGFDLSRSPAGREVSQILLAALSADARYAIALAGRAVAPARVRARATALAEAVQAVSGTAAVVDLTDARGDAGGGHGADHAVGHVAGPAPDRVVDRDLTRIARRVRAISFGGPLDLLDLLRRDGLEHLQEQDRHQDMGGVGGALRGLAVRHLCDALLAELAQDPGSPTDLDDLAAAFRTTAPPPDPDLGPYAVDVEDLLDGVRRGGRGPDPYGLLAPVSSPPGEWSAAMHVASWAVELTGRTRCAAAAHMMAVAALTDAGFTGDDAAAGAWNALSGMVIARLVADLLPAAEHAVLARNP